MYINDPGHMIKMAAMHMYGNILLQNQWTDFNETWHEALMTKALQ